MDTISIDLKESLQLKDDSNEEKPEESAQAADNVVDSNADDLAVVLNMTAEEAGQRDGDKGRNDFKTVALRLRNVARMRRIVETLRNAKKGIYKLHV
jgi:hypothetical protein